MSKPFHNPFGALANLHGTQPDQIDESKPTETKPSATAPPARAIARAVVRIERSGRSGKEVTVVEHLELPEAELEVWLKALKAALGCGGSVEGRSLILQGDHRKRLTAVLTKRGVRKVTVA